MSQTQASTGTRYCISCGTQNLAVAHFCSACGRPMEALAAPAAPDPSATAFTPSTFAPPVAPPVARPPAPGALPPTRIDGLYDPRSVAIATFLGAPFAGALLMAINYAKLGKKSSVLPTVLVGLVLAAASVFLGMALQSTSWGNGAGMGLAVGLMFGMMNAARSLQGREIEQQRAAGARLGSRWAAAGIGLGCLAVTIGVIIAFSAAATPDYTKLAVDGDDLYYSAGVTQQEANALVAAFKNDGYFQGHGVAVFVDRGRSGTSLGFAVKSGVWDNPEYVNGYQVVVREVAPAIGGLPIKLQFLDANRAVKREIDVQPGAQPQLQQPAPSR